MGIALLVGVHRRHLAIEVVLCMTVLTTVLLPRPVHGHSGGEPVVSEAWVDPFVLYVWLDPLPAIVGEQHITVSVNTPMADNADETVSVRDAEVWVLATRTGDFDLATAALATHEQATNKLFYEARLELPQPGSWRISVVLTVGAETATHEFVLNVEEPRAERAEPLVQRFTAWLRDLFSRS